jgi:hypothetical protein
LTRVSIANSLEENDEGVGGLEDAQAWLCCRVHACCVIGRCTSRRRTRRHTEGALGGRKNPPPEPGRKACWRRVYDAKHLAAHPQQKTTKLTFFLRVSGYDAGGGYVFKNPHHILYNFAFSLKRRGKRALATGGDCLGGKTADCVVDCDGGGIPAHWR